jgi:hypothetical protein
LCACVLCSLSRPSFRDCTVRTGGMFSPCPSSCSKSSTLCLRATQLHSSIVTTSRGSSTLKAPPLPRSAHHCNWSVSRSRRLLHTARGSVFCNRVGKPLIKSRGQNILRLTPSPASTLHPTSIFSSSPSLLSHPNNPRKRNFSSSLVTMTATKIDGTAIAKSIRERLHSEIENTQKSNPRYKPSLKIIQGETWTGIWKAMC